MNAVRLFALLPILLTGCLKTRGQLRSEVSDTTPQIETVSAQRKQAAEGEATVTTVAAPGKPVASAAKVDDMDEQMRNVIGRVEVTENTINQIITAGEAVRGEYTKEKLSLEQRLLTYEEAIKKLNADVASLNEQVTALKAVPVQPQVTLIPATPKDPLEVAAEMFAAKKWKDAAAAFQRYREAFPKGKSYADATYKIGVSFQELGLKDEAKSFYDEVVAKYPKTKEAKKAAIRLKSLK